MADINLVTGYTGEAHIKSEDDALLNSFLAGQDNSVINLESEFNDTDCDISADALVGGRLARTGGDVNLTFTKPSSGYYRYDAIYIVYKKVTSGIESAELVYCEGTENASQEGAEQNIGQPTIGADVVDYSVIQLYTVAWDNAQTKTVTKTAESASTNISAYCVGKVGTDAFGSWYVDFTLPLSKALRDGQTLKITSPSATIYYKDGIGGQAATIVGNPTVNAFGNYANVTLHISAPSSPSNKRGVCSVYFTYSYEIA